MSEAERPKSKFQGLEVPSVDVNIDNLVKKYGFTEKIARLIYQATNLQSGGGVKITPGREEQLNQLNELLRQKGLTVQQGFRLHFKDPKLPKGYLVAGHHSDLRRQMEEGYDTRTIRRIEDITLIKKTKELKQ